jgi:dCTP deaminase
MILNGEEIRFILLDSKKDLETESFDDKLIITPLLQLEDQIRKDTVSVDLRLGTKFVFVNKFFLSHTDPKHTETDIKPSISDYEVMIGSHLILHPNQFILGETLEWIKMPNYLAGLLTAKSSNARDGLQVESANLIHPRFSGTITFELKNNGEVPIKLYPGMLIAQISFIQLHKKITSESPISKSSIKFEYKPRPVMKQSKDFETIMNIYNSLQGKHKNKTN